MIFSGVALLFDVRFVSADASESSTGWLWGGTEEVDGGSSEDTTGLGWISLNSSNCDTDNDGQSEGATGCPATGTTVADYGVHIPATDGDLNGYAWSENVGWISFQPSDLAGCPQAPCNAYRLDDGIYGWARVVSIRDAASNSGGFDGWIKLHSLTGDPVSYGLTIDTTTTPNEVNGYAWSDEFGWIRAVNVEIAASESLIVCPPAVTMTIDGTFQLRAYYRPGESILSCNDVLLTDTDVTTTSTWSSNNTGVVTVGASTGIATGIATGGPIDVTVAYLTESGTGLVSVNGVTSPCGNGIIDSGEVCDQGASANGSCTTGVLYDHDSDPLTDDVTCSGACEINACQCTPSN